MIDFVEIEENRRVVDTGKNKLTMVRNGSTGFWSIQNENGPVPTQLKQVFTSTREAAIAIRDWIDQAPKRKEIYSNK